MPKRLERLQAYLKSVREDNHVTVPITIRDLEYLIDLAAVGAKEYDLFVNDV